LANSQVVSAPPPTPTNQPASEPHRPNQARAGAEEYLLGGRERLLLLGDLRGDLARDPLAHLAPDVGDVLPPRGRRRLLLPRRRRRGGVQDDGRERDGEEQGDGASRHLRWVSLFAHLLSCSASAAGGLEG